MWFGVILRWKLNADIIPLLVEGSCTLICNWSSCLTEQTRHISSVFGKVNNINKAFQVCGAMSGQLQVGHKWPLLFGQKKMLTFMMNLVMDALIWKRWPDLRRDFEPSRSHCKFTRKEICFTNCYIMQIIILIGIKLNKFKATWNA